MRTTIVVPTFRRPQLLGRCLGSCRRLATLEGHEWEVVVVDNSPEASARGQVEGYAEEAGISVRYAHEPRPGISAARNCGLSLCSGQYVAFLDDDEAARPAWLGELHAALQHYGGAAAFGKVIVEVPEGADWARALLEQSIGRDLAAPAGEVPRKLEAKLGTGNSLFRLDVLDGERTFDDSLGLSGGEDTDVIAGVLRAGGRLVWAPSAEVDEAVESARVRLRFLLERRFGSGQMRAQREVQGSGGLPKAALWMGLGLGQAAVGSARVLAQALTGRDPRAALCDVAAGLGKVLWFPQLRLQRYRRASPPSPGGASQ